MTTAWSHPEDAGDEMDETGVLSDGDDADDLPDLPQGRNKCATKAPARATKAMEQRGRRQNALRRLSRRSRAPGQAQGALQSR